MFEFLFRNRKTEAKPESQRERFERLILELNEVIDTLPHKPAVTVHPETGRISFNMPAQFMDEALALPKPSLDPVAEPKAETETKTPPNDTAAEPSAPTKAKGEASSAKRATAPVPNPPKPTPPKPKAPKPAR